MTLRKSFILGDKSTKGLILYNSLNEKRSELRMLDDQLEKLT